MFGLFVELGPLLLNADSLNADFVSTGIPQLVRNPYSWSRFANLLIVDNPPPVGFSWCSPAGQVGTSNACGPWNDTNTAQANHEFLSVWFQTQFPELLPNDLYIVGESYAGIYVPMIVREILADPRGLNLKGFSVGDGCLGTEVLCGDSSGPYYDIEFLHGHGQFSQELYHTIRLSCPEADLRSGHLTTQCQALVAQMTQEVGGYYGYNLYDDCIYSEGTRRRNLGQGPRRYWSSAPPMALPLRGQLNLTALSLEAALTDYPCPGSALSIWLNRTDVRAALHVASDATFISGDNGVGFPYTSSEPNLLPFYQQLAQSSKLRVLVYNGDTDPGINSMITQDLYYDAMRQANIKQLQPWRPWTTDGKQRMGGYVTEFEGRFNYLTIRGSGHMVPEFKPQMAYEFMSTFIKGTADWKSYVGPSN